ncbi:MAG: glycosyltransferase family 2 protein [Gemmataceae bacterium]|nr:glycosyltransferase family 2 protein [Gemmataceae bacterium]
MATVATIIVNYRTADLVVDCLKSLALERPGRVIVVDSGSPDDSVARLKSAVALNEWADWCTILPLERNVGYAAGNNAGMRHAAEIGPKPAYYWLLNPDTVVRPGALAALLDFMAEHSEVGIVGSRLEDPDGTVQRSAFRFPSILGELEGGLRLGPVTKLLQGWVIAPPARDIDHQTDWVAGASMLIRQEVVESIGPMDEGFFLYFEEVDYCNNALRHGWPCWYVPESRVVHLVGQSTGVTDTRAARKRVPDYWFAARRRYYRRNHGWLYRLLADAAWAGGFALWRVRRVLQRKPDTDPPGLLGDFMRHSLGLAPGKAA